MWLAQASWCFGLRWGCLTLMWASSAEELNPCLAQVLPTQTAFESRP